MRRHSSRRILPILAATALATGPGPCFAATVLFAEDFNSVALTASPTYGVPSAYSPVPPPGWNTITSIPAGGVPEWRGWAMARKTFWQGVGAATGDAPGRGQFTRGSGTIAVADPDLWNSPQVGFGDPANRAGFFYSFLRPPVIDLDARPAGDDRVTLAFDSSWLSLQCCDDGDLLNPPLNHRNNQTAVIRARIDGGAPIELLRWESAPYYDANGLPTMLPMMTNGSPNTPNPNYLKFALDERVFLDLNALLPPPPAQVPGEAMRGPGDIQIEFAVENAGDDGWWAVDNVEVASFGTLLGDMNFSGDLDQGDYDAFALGMLDTDAYRVDFWGAYPVENGSLDSTFDFDDIPWFLAVMKDVGAPASAFSQAFFAIPEPTGAALSLVATLLYATRRRQG